LSGGTDHQRFGLVITHIFWMIVARQATRLYKQYRCLKTELLEGFFMYNLESCDNHENPETC